MLVGVVWRMVSLKMLALFSDDVMAWLGPAIGPQAFEVGEDVLQAFVDFDSKLSAHLPLVM